jgi:hypothetical protein
MPRPRKGARLWLRPASRDASGKIIENARWLIKDGGRQIGTECGANAREEAEKRLADYIASKYAPERRQRALSEIRISDVIGIYLADVAPGLANPAKAGERAERLLEFWGLKTLDEITGASCREYEVWRDGKGRTNKGTGGGARRDLQETFRLRLAIILKKGFTAKLCALCCLSAAKLGNDGLPVANSLGFYGYAGARVRFKMAERRTSGHCGTFAGF